MNTDYTAKITEIFYSVDEFCKQIEPQFKKKAIGKDGKKSRNRAFKMSDSEIITILILFQPEFGLSHFSKNKVRPTFGVRHQLPETLSQKCTGLPLQPPTRTRSARVRCFSFFAFTSSPYDCKKLGNSDLRVKVSPLFPSPVKAKKEPFLHAQRTQYQRIAGEGEG